MSLFACCLKPQKSAIDKELEIQAYQDKLRFKVLLLGAGESGKSTVLKQLKLIHKISLTTAEVKETAFSLKRNCVECINVLVDMAQQFGYAEDAEFAAKSARIKKLGNDLKDEDVTTDIADCILSLWKSQIIQKTFQRKNEFWILDAAEYYFENIERFVQEDFDPSEEDLVMARVMTSGIIKTEIQVPPLQFQVVDVGGQRNERRKWIHCFDDIHAIIYVVNLAGYNSVLFEDRGTNRMVECLNLFKQTVNNAIFANTPVFLLFNKKDLFEKLIKTDPLNLCPAFSDYTGSGDVMTALNYITAKFKSQIQSGDPDRIQTFHIAARFKRDVKTTWDDVANNLRKKHAKQIESAIKSLKAVEMQ